MMNQRRFPRIKAKSRHHHHSQSINAKNNCLRNTVDKSKSSKCKNVNKFHISYQTVLSWKASDLHKMDGFFLQEPFIFIHYKTIISTIVLFKEMVRQSRLCGFHSCSICRAVSHHELFSNISSLSHVLGL